MRRRLRKPFVGLLLLAGSSWTLTGCFTTSADYQRDAEEFILNDENLTEALFATDPPPASGATEITSVTCEDPQSQEPGTTFICTAVDDADGDWEFEIEIQASDGYDVNVSRRPPG